MSYKNNYIPNNVILNSNILPQSKGQSSTFDLSEGLMTTIGFDKLYPVMWEELNPGDHLKVNVQSLARLMPMVTAPMSNIKLKYFAFFVPNRTIWDNWKGFMGAKEFLEDSTDFIVPQVLINSQGAGQQSLADYMGIPKIPDSKSLEVSALPFRAYNKIWTEWFRAMEIQEPLRVVHDNESDYRGLLEGEMGGLDAPMYQLRKKGKALDYFTSALPFPQSGEPVLLPLTGNAPVKANTTLTDTPLGFTNSEGVKTALAVNSNLVVNGGTAQDPGTQLLYADMSEVTGISIEQLRKASAIQVALERDAKAGQSYIELMNMHYGTTIPDFLVGRSQFLGSYTDMVNVEPIANTSGTSTTPQGNIASVGIQSNRGDLCEVSAIEHGIFMILACVDGEVTYQQGIPRKFDKHARFDYMNPAFWNLGDQAIKNKEIFVTGDFETDEATFGYQERYREYRQSFGKVSGLMRSNVEGSLDVWHLAEKFNNLPTLNSEFIQCNTPIDRVMAVPTEDQLILNCYFDIKATRNLPTTSNPSLLAGRV